MKKVVSSEEMQGLDKRTINEYNISSLKLMENAGLTVYEFLMNEYRDLKEKKVLIISGTGNNGADGLVIARHLKKSGISVCIYVINPEKNEGSPEFKENYEKIKKDVKVSFYYGNEKDIDDFINEIDKSDIIIDAIFGTGLSRDMDEKYIKIIQIVNSSNLKKISVDIPSGLDANTGFERPVSVISDNTVTFGLPKKGFYINSGPKSTGDLIVKNIGFPEKVIKEINAGIYLIEEEDVTCLLPERKKDSHKGNTGRLLIVGGSEGLSGALILSAKAALRTGAGMVYLAYPEKIGIQIETSVIEAVKIPYRVNSENKPDKCALNNILEIAENVDFALIGPGMGRDLSTMEFIKALLENIEKPVLIDADALYAMSQMKIIIKSKHVILTPHPLEFARLKKKDLYDLSKNIYDILMETSQELNAIIVFKKNNTLVSFPEGIIHINSTGNPALSKGGSGDVLSGIIASIACQTKNIKGAVDLGVFLHGICADEYIKSRDYLSMNSSDICDILPYMIKKLRELKEKK